MSGDVLKALGPNAAPAVPSLLKVYKGGGPCIEVLTTLARIGPPAKEALPILKKAQKDDFAPVRAYATAAIEAITKK